MTQEKLNLEQQSAAEATSTTQYDDEKRIVLFKNDRATEDNHEPAIRGQVTINGTKWYISLWNQKTKDGKVYCQGKVRKADELTNTTNESLM